MNQRPKWILLMKKTRAVKSRATVPLRNMCPLICLPHIGLCAQVCRIWKVSTYMLATYDSYLLLGLPLKGVPHVRVLFF
jgi:hypothetical protein